ncbi:hypothetical protein SDC9_136729 [bioreactor metagenome]|uniref:Uncharacterized protein n=1 Tax=bioreactor metagenome TaxID=1076179 RepID=A0A645DK17_9ZZZZ
MIAQVGPGYDKHSTGLFPHVVLAETDGAQPLGAGALEELQVVRIEHDTTCVGVFPVDAHRPFEGRGAQAV